MAWWSWTCPEVIALNYDLFYPFTLFEWAKLLSSFLELFNDIY